MTRSRVRREMKSGAGGSGMGMGVWLDTGAVGAGMGDALCLSGVSALGNIMSLKDSWMGDMRITRESKSHVKMRSSNCHRKDRQPRQGSMTWSNAGLGP